MPGIHAKSFSCRAETTFLEEGAVQSYLQRLTLPTSRSGRSVEGSSTRPSLIASTK